MNESLWLIIPLIALVPLCGIASALTPWLMPRSECFTVTVPENMQNDPRLRAFKLRYLAIMVAVSIACTVFAAIEAAALTNGADEGAFTWAFVIATLLPVVIGFALMLHYRKQVQRIKDNDGWIAQEQLSAAVIAEEDVPKPLPLAWNILYIPVIALTAVFVFIYYPSMPDTIPMQMDFSGNITSTMPKSLGTVLFPVYVDVFMAICFVFCHWSMLRSKAPTDAGKPATSAYAYGKFARAQSVFLLVSGLLMCIAMGIPFVMATAGKLSLGQAGAIIMVACIVLVVGIIILMAVYGQSGSRLFSRMEASKDMPADDDRFWKLGVLYVNPNDASVFLPKRFGVGWTVNFGRPVTWIVIVAFIALTMLFCVFVESLA